MVHGTAFIKEIGNIKTLKIFTRAVDFGIPTIEIFPFKKMEVNTLLPGHLTLNNSQSPVKTIQSLDKTKVKIDTKYKTLLVDFFLLQNFLHVLIRPIATRYKLFF